MKVKSVLASAFLVVGCMHAEDVRDPFREAVSALKVPSEVDGQIDTGTEYYLFLKSECGEALRLCELYNRVIADTYAGELEVFGYQGKDAEFSLTAEEISQAASTIRTENVLWLRSEIQDHGWFTIDEYGTDADLAAFLLVQHADELSIQEEILSYFKPIVEAGDSSPQNYALLYDRVRVRNGEVQFYSSQGRCNEEGKWLPFATEQSENVDERRVEIGLPTVSDYSANMTTKYC